MYKEELLLMENFKLDVLKKAHNATYKKFDVTHTARNLIMTEILKGEVRCRFLRQNITGK